MRGRSRVLCWLGAIAVTLLALRAQAVTLDEVSVSTQGKDVVVRVVFAGNVRVLQQAPTAEAQLFQTHLFRVEITKGDDSWSRPAPAEYKRLAPTGATPAMTFELSSLPSLPNQRAMQLTVRTDEKLLLRARPGPNLRTIDLVLVEREAPKPHSASAAPSYFVMLESVPAAALDRLHSIPKSLETYKVFDSRSVVNGVEMFEVNLGYFATREEAEQVRTAALKRFPEARVVSPPALADVAPKIAAGQTSGQSSEEGHAPVPAPAPMPIAADSAVAEPVAGQGIAPPAAALASGAQMADIEAKAAALLADAKKSVAQSQDQDAVRQLNQLLLLPPNRATQEAQELIGFIWERLGEPRRAKAEYDLYLKLYPGTEGARRVSRQLAAMGAPADAASPDGAQGTAVARPAPGKITGSIAQYYFGGKARSQSLVNLSSGIDQSTLTKTTESAIVTSVDLGGRYATKESEIRLVVRGTGSTNLAKTSHNTSLLSAAYMDYKRLDSGFAVRLGRQAAINGGLLGMFDGASMIYPVKQGMRVSLMGGVPANQLVSAPAERLIAALIEDDVITDRWGGNLYVIDQTTEGITNRRALGAEARYSSERGSMYALLDYDMVFRAVNAASLQGTLQGPSQTTFTLLVDVRKAPSLQLTNALISTGLASLKTLLRAQTLNDVKDTALGTTAQARQVMVSASRPLSEKWQLTGDLQFSQVGALPAVGTFDATPATGAQYGLTLQLTGSNLYSRRDINNFNMSVLSTPYFHGAQLAYNNLTSLRDDKYTVEPSIRLYSQRDNLGVKLLRISPGLRASYRISSRASVLGETLYEHSTTEGPTNHDATNSLFFYMGYRYDLF